MLCRRTQIQQFELSCNKASLRFGQGWLPPYGPSFFCRLNVCFKKNHCEEIFKQKGFLDWVIYIGMYDDLIDDYIVFICPH